LDEKSGADVGLEREKSGLAKRMTRCEDRGFVTSFFLYLG